MRTATELIAPGHLPSPAALNLTHLRPFFPRSVAAQIGNLLFRRLPTCAASVMARAADGQSATPQAGSRRYVSAPVSIVFHDVKD